MKVVNRLMQFYNQHIRGVRIGDMVKYNPDLTKNRWLHLPPETVGCLGVVIEKKRDHPCLMYRIHVPSVNVTWWFDPEDWERVK